MTDDFDPEATSTGPPEADLYRNPQPGTSSSFMIDRPKSKSPRKSVKKSSIKTPKKSPKQELRRTPSQPSIRSFASPGQPGSSSGPKRQNSSRAERSAPRAKKSKVKRILSDLSLAEREIVGAKEDALLKEDSSIKEAVADPESILPPVPSPTSPNLGELADIFPTPAVSPTPKKEPEASPESPLPSKEEFNVSPPEDASASAIEPLQLSSSEEHRGSSAGTSNELGKFDDEAQEDDQVNEDNANQADDNPPQANPDDHIVFNIQNTLVAQATLEDSPQIRVAPPTPEHVLIVVEDFDTITHIITFDRAHDPADILNAYWDNSINMAMPDEGFENSASITPSAPPPTPSTSTEAVRGSSETPILSPETSTEGPAQVAISFVTNVATDRMILNMSDMPSLEEKANNEEETQEEGERKEEKEKGDYAN